jgi:hypothetical protein
MADKTGKKGRGGERRKIIPMKMENGKTKRTKT